MASHPGTLKIPIMGLFFENRLHCYFEVEKKILQTAILSSIFIYVQIKH